MSLPSEKVAHYQHTIDYGWEWRILNPTGRWKLRADNDGEIHLLIEHKGRIFKRWIHESGIKFKHPEEEIINVCNIT